MATVLEECTTEEQCSVVRLLGAKVHNAKDIHHKERFPVYGGKCLSRKGVHIWEANVSLMTKRSKLEVWKWLRTVKRPLCCWFRRTGKTMGQVYQCWWRICGEINVFFQVRISHILRFISIYDQFTDSPSYFEVFY
jgi:hypothetical protein